MKPYILAAAGLLMLAAACNKPDENATLKVTPRHHSRAIDSCTIYIKYNATDAPTNGVYDDSAKCVKESGVPVATFRDLKNGNYYIYGYGWDPGFTPPSHVKGGFAYPVSTGGEQTLELAVSEI